MFCSRTGRAPVFLIVEASVKRRTFILGVLFSGGSLIIATGKKAYAAGSVQLEVRPGQTLMDVLEAAGYRVEFDRDYRDVAQVITGRGRTLRADPLYMKRLHLVALFRGKPINTRNLSGRVTIGSFFPDRKGKVEIRVQRFDPQKAQKGLSREPSL